MDRQDDAKLFWSYNGPARQVAVWVTGWDFVWECHMGDRAIVTKFREERGLHRYDHPGCYWITASPQGESTIFGRYQVLIRDELQPNVTVDTDPDDPMTRRVWWPPVLDVTSVVSRYHVSWGDGQVTDQTYGFPGEYVAHRYDTAGAKILTVTDLNTTRMKRFDFRINPTDLDFTLSMTGQAVTLTTASTASLIVDWGDGTVAHPLTGGTATHTYPVRDEPTTYLVQLWLADASHSVTKPVTFPARRT